MGRYGDHLSFMVENVVEFDGQDPTIDLERVLVAYAFDDKLQIGAGRDHTAFGYWNRTFHHGAHLQTTIDRPFFIAFEDGGSSGIPSKGGAVPSHFVGVFADGTFDLGASALKYELNVGNNGSISLNGDGETRRKPSSTLIPREIPLNRSTRRAAWCLSRRPRGLGFRYRRGFERIRRPGHAGSSHQYLPAGQYVLHRPGPTDPGRRGHLHRRQGRVLERVL